MIGRKTEKVLNRAIGYAFERDHEYFTLEHVLLSLLEENRIQEILEACGASSDALSQELQAYLEKEVPKRSSPSEGSENQTGSDHDVIENPMPTLGVQRLIQRAIFHVQSAGKDEIEPQDLLVALFQSKDSHALYLLIKQGVERLDVLNFISHAVRKDDENLPATPEETDSKTANSGNGSSKASDALAAYAINLNELARSGKIDPLIGRQTELSRIVQTLCRRRKNNPLLVGEAGVGKTALAEGLALRIVAGEVPDLLQKAEVYSLDLGSLVAGTRFRGDFEKRLKGVLKGLEDKKKRGISPILYIDEIHTIIGAGSVGQGSLDAAHLLKPLLSRGEIQCMGSTTYAEYRTVFEKDHALSRRFQKLDVSEPSSEEAVQILVGLKQRFEEHHHVTFTTEAIRAAVELSVKHLTSKFLPDKAIDILDESGAKARLAGLKLVDKTDIEEVVAQIARIPARSISVTQKERLKSLERDLKLVIYGQSHAVEAIVTAIRLARSGLRSGDRPVGSFLFCGPTGVGKTELSKQLAHNLGVPFLRFDMSEYMEKHTVSRLIGAPPGYVGFEQAGMLTDAVLKHPHAVVLLDEIEKAHSDVWNILLQIMDHGTLTDSNGRKADFRNIILILTSNVGSREHERKPLGLSGQVNPGAASQKEVERTFSPEFRNRLDGTIFFNPLDPVAIAQVVGKQLMELESQLLAKGVELEVTSDVREWLARKGYDPLMGARPLTRIIQDKLKKPLAEEILFGKLENGGTARVSVRNEEFIFEFVPPRQRVLALSSAPAQADPETPLSE
ncbi:MAG: ATP-dependent Clp protease ATP-binding subunit ClpA [Bdellovibrionota bacterium]